MNILDTVGNTPLLKLRNVYTERRGISIYAKAEFMNPSGSVKDRAAREIILSAQATGALAPGMRILDSTSGSTGIAYCMMGNYLGVPVTVCMPSNTGQVRKQIITAYGGEIIETDPLEGTEGAVAMARGLAEAHPERYYYPDQYANPANWKAHYHTTACEIYEQTRGAVTHFIAAAGTGGTFFGTTKRLKVYDPNIQAVLVQPDSPFHGLEGLRHLKSTSVQGFFQWEQVDREVEIRTEDAWRMVRVLARKEGLLVGISSAANVLAALAVAETAPEGSCLVTILADSGLRYLSGPVWEKEREE